MCFYDYKGEELTLYFLNCEFERIHSDNYYEGFSFHKGNLVMKSCKIMDNMFHFKDSSNILMMDNIFFYTQNSDNYMNHYIQIEDLKSEAIFEYNVFYIRNIEEEPSSGSWDETLIKFTNSKNEPKIAFCNNYIHQTFEYEMKEYFYPDTLLGFGIDKLKKLKFHKNIYVESLNKKENRRPILFDSTLGNLSKTPCPNLVLDIEIDKTNVDSNEFWASDDYPNGITQTNFLLELIRKCNELENYKDFKIKISKNQYSKYKIRCQFKKEELIKELKENIKRILKKTSSKTKSDSQYASLDLNKN